MTKIDNNYIKFNSYIKKSLLFIRMNYLKKQYCQSSIMIEQNNISQDKPLIRNQEDDLLNSIFIKDLLSKAKLNSKENFIIYNYYYLQKTDNYIGNKLGVSKQAVNKLRKACLNKLKAIAS